MPDIDVAVVGAGFAGLIAARELSSHGVEVTVLEGRDRTGGRTWVDERLGTELELGGTWVHWLEPHVWSEINRYREPVQITGTALGLEMSWLVDGDVRSASAEAAEPLLDEALRRVFEASREHFPAPYADPAGYGSPTSSTGSRSATSSTGWAWTRTPTCWPTRSCRRRSAPACTRRR